MPENKEMAELKARVTALEALMERQKVWAKSVNGRIDELEFAQPASSSSASDRKAIGAEERKWPEAINELSIPPVPADYDGLFAAYGWDKDADEMMLWAPNELIDNPHQTAQDGGDDYAIIAVISKAGKACWMGVLAEAFQGDDAPQRKQIENTLEGSVNEGRECSPVNYDFIRSVRGKQTDIDIEAWKEKRIAIETAEVGDYEPADEDPF